MKMIVGFILSTTKNLKFSTFEYKTMKKPGNP